MWLNIVSAMFLIFGVMIILVDQFTVSDVRFGCFSFTLYGILLIAGSVCLRYRMSIGWWWILINAIAISALLLFGVFSSDVAPDVVDVILSLLTISSAVVLAINHPWKWGKD
ncbi:MAG: hypothetical protein GX139_05715 [Armatimonadetes bacterium]|nr:hypothetical protein [Armatimonadota bacterium]